MSRFDNLAYSIRRKKRAKGPPAPIKSLSPPFLSSSYKKSPDYVDDNSHNGLLTRLLLPLVTFAHTYPPVHSLTLDHPSLLSLFLSLLIFPFFASMKKNSLREGLIESSIHKRPKKKKKEWEQIAHGHPAFCSYNPQVTHKITNRCKGNKAQNPKM